MINFIRKLMRQRIVLWTHVHVKTGKVQKRALLMDKNSDLYKSIKDLK